MTLFQAAPAVLFRTCRPCRGLHYGALPPQIALHYVSLIWGY